VQEIWAYVEISGEKILRVSQETLSEAIRQATQLRARTTAVVLGHLIPREILEGIGRFGPDRVLVMEDEGLAEYSTEAYGSCLEKLLKEYNPDVFLLGSSVASRDLAPRLSAHLKCSLVTEATFLNPRGDRFLVTRPAYRPHASMIAGAREKGLQLITLASKVMDSEEVGASESFAVEEWKGRVEFKASPVSVEEKIREVPSQLDLTDAGVIVAGGKGMHSEQDFRLLDELAEVIGGTVGATRMAVDLKWRSRESMVGVTGKVVSPEVYIACGISGAIQHVMGMRSAQIILAINTDPNAPIFRIATLGIIGDVREVLPMMIESFKQIKARSEVQETHR
jgi:electron transfer flavoprotein alpha subunit